MDTSFETAETALGEVRINGRLLPVADGEPLSSVQERAWGELLRQAAVRDGALSDQTGDTVPALDAESQAAIDQWLEREVQTPEPGDEACARYYEANKQRFRHGQQAWVRHILFAVTPKVPVQALAKRAEAVLLELTHKDADAGLFAKRAKELSNCPSGAEGGDLGWLSPDDCAPEFAQFLFFQRDEPLATGLQPRLVHTRHGLHIVDVLDQRAGKLATLEQVKGSIATTLELRSRATALRQYLMLLVGQADIQGLDLEGADTPLVQ